MPAMQRKKLTFPKNSRALIAGEVRAVEGSEYRREVSFSSETPVRRWFGNEILDHGPDAEVDLSRLTTVGAVLFNHDPNRIVAKIVSASIDTKARRGNAIIEFVPDDEESMRAMRKVDSGMLLGISVGYSVHRWTEDDETEDVRVNKWEAYEISLTPIPADAKVGVGRSLDGDPHDTTLEARSTRGIVRASSPAGETAMFKLKSGREVSLAELDALRMQGDVELADGTILSRQIPASVLDYARANQPAPATVPAKPAARAVAPVVEVEPETDETHKRALTVTTGEADPVKAKLQHDIRQLGGFMRAAAPKGSIPDGEEDLLILKGSTLDEARAHFVKLAEDTRAAVTGRMNDDGTTVSRPNISVGEDKNLRTMFDAIPDAIAIRAGVVSAEGKNLRGKGEVKLHERAASLSGLKLMQIVRMHVEATTGVSTVRLSDKDVLKLAGRDRGTRSMQNTSDFSTLLENTLNKMVIIGYRNAPSTYRDVAKIIPATDLRQHNLHSAGGISSLAKVADSAEVVRGRVFDSKKETLTPAQFSRIFAITDATFINDDMDALASLPNEFGAAADTTVNEWHWYQFLQASGAGPTMNEDSVALYDVSTHANYVTSSGAVPSATTFNTAFGAMMTKVGLNSKPLGALTTPKIIAIPPSLRGTTIDFLSTEYLITSNNKKRNVYFEAVTPVIEPLLELGVTLEGDNAPAAVSGDANAWMLFADPNLFPTSVVAFYDGDMPKVVQNRPIDMLGTEYRVELAFGVGIANWRGTYKNDGE